MGRMDNDRPIIFEGKPGLCWHCGHGEVSSVEGQVAGKGCNQWLVTRPVSVSNCRAFLNVDGLSL
jgi:hypothetical protein